MKSVATDYASGSLDINSINSSEITKECTLSELPDPDLVIRTSGEENFKLLLADCLFRASLHRCFLAVFL